MSVRAMSMPICVRGRYLWRGDARFFIRGVVYQIHGVTDPISDDRIPQLKRDILLFKELGLNTIFVFSVDNDQAHDKAMSLLEEAGIYVLTTVSTPSCTINRLKPYRSYKSTTMMSFFRTVDVLASYSNTLGVLAASELVNNAATASATPLIKAVVRDIKKYMKLKNKINGQRILPIGYNAATCDPLDRTILDYLTLDPASSSIDFWTIDHFRHAAIPMFFSEYGSSARQPRLFQETKALYSEQMSQVFSGGCVYEFWQGGNGYGLVEFINQEDNTQSSANQKSLSRAPDSHKVVEKREMDEGFLLIYHDFANYKANLAATRGVKSKWDHDNFEPGMMARLNIATTHTSWPWEPQFREPESCVDWAQIEEYVRSAVRR